MACGDAKFTGKLGVYLATSGPGGIHLLHGLHDATLDGQPVLAITGAFPTRLRAVRAGVWPAGFTIEDPARCGDVLDEALASPGPAVIQAVVDPFESPMPAKITVERAAHFAQSLIRGEPNREKILLTVLADKVRSDGGCRGRRA